MQADFSRMSVRTDEERRTLRIARGLRAVAATVIVGGIVIAAFDTVPTTEHELEPALERSERAMEHPG